MKNKKQEELIGASIPSDSRPENVLGTVKIGVDSNLPKTKKKKEESYKSFFKINEELQKGFEITLEFFTKDNQVFVKHNKDQAFPLRALLTGKIKFPELKELLDAIYDHIELKYLYTKTFQKWKREGKRKQDIVYLFLIKYFAKYNGYLRVSISVDYKGQKDVEFNSEVESKEQEGY